MSYQTRPVATGVTVCDLCDNEIRGEREKQMSGSLIRGYIPHPVSPATKHVWFHSWLPEALKNWRHGHARPHAEGKKYDFHYECIEKLVREAVASRLSADSEASR